MIITSAHTIGFSEWLFRNRWYHFENGFWFQTMEHPTAGMSKETYNKYYRKTSMQLFIIYLTSIKAEYMNKGIDELV